VKCTEGWETQGFRGYVGTGWYRVRFITPESLKDAPCLRLFFPAVDEDATVYINGKKAFEHTCESTGLTPDQIWKRPFAFDPTPFLNFGGENVLAVRVYNRGGMGGVYKPVSLVSTDEEIDPAYLEGLIQKK
ncbi:MAG: hypothetical protein GY851_15115, partial [bacterium]|nr:hypothetical protein [bacterium]